MRPLRDSSPILEDTEALRARAEKEGYLYLRGLLPRDEVDAVRRDFVAILSRHGWLDPDTNPDDLISTQPACIEGMPEFWPVFDDFQRLESFHALAHQRPLLEVLERLFGEPVLVHPRNIGRIMFPSTPPTPPHQDYIHIQGTPEVWTAWIPLMDVPVELGGIAVLVGTHRQGIYPVQRMPGAGGVGIDTARFYAEWATDDYNMGDVLLFHSETIHRSLTNITGNRIRLSVDYRYQGVSQPIAEGSLLPHFQRFGWDFVYKDWKSTRYQYYWRKWDLNIVPFDRNVFRFQT